MTTLETATVTFTLNGQPAEVRALTLILAREAKWLVQIDLGTAPAVEHGVAHDPPLELRTGVVHRLARAEQDGVRGQGQLSRRPGDAALHAVGERRARVEPFLVRAASGVRQSLTSAANSPMD